jgi:RNA polymerase sigma factor (TIGR02999 family)
MVRDDECPKHFRGSGSDSLPHLAPGDATRILQRIETGDPSAADELLPLVYEELRRLAAAKLADEKPGQTLQATALVHEAYVRLVDTARVQHWNSRGHFFRAAAEAMRRLLINRARDKKRLKRGGDLHRIDLGEVAVTMATAGDDLLDLDQALQRLAGEHPASAELASMRLFAGFSLKEAGNAMGISERTARRHWAYARAWLFDALRDDDSRNDSAHGSS